MSVERPMLEQQSDIQLVYLGIIGLTFGTRRMQYAETAKEEGLSEGRGGDLAPPPPTFCMVKKILYFILLNHMHHLQKQLTLHIRIKHIK